MTFTIIYFLLNGQDCFHDSRFPSHWGKKKKKACENCTVGKIHCHYFPHTYLTKLVKLKNLKIS